MQSARNKPTLIMWIVCTPVLPYVRNVRSSDCMGRQLRSCVRLVRGHARQLVGAERIRGHQQLLNATCRKPRFFTPFPLPLGMHSTWRASCEDLVKSWAAQRRVGASFTRVVSILQTLLVALVFCGFQMTSTATAATSSSGLLSINFLGLLLRHEVGVFKRELVLPLC